MAIASLSDTYDYGFTDGMAGEERAFLPFGETGCAYTVGYDAALTAKIWANAPLKPKTAQCPCDAGLFGDSHQQKELKL